MKKNIVLLLIPFSLLITSCNETHPSLKTYKITILDSTNGKVVTDKEEAIENELVSLTPQGNYGYEVDTIKVNGEEIDGYEFKMPASDVEIEATFIVGEYDISIKESPYGIIISSLESAKYGERVTLDYEQIGNYVLDHFLVNGEEIDGYNFLMPGEDAIIEGVYKEAIKDYAASFTVYGGGVGSSSYWSFEYDDNGININVKVIDRYICDVNYIQDPGYRDNIEFIISNRSDDEYWSINNSTKVLISCDGGTYVQKAQTSTSWGYNMIPSSSDFTYNTDLRNSKEDGYDGYEVNAFLSYDFMNITKEDALGNFSISMAQRNSMFYNATNWDFYRNDNSLWENVNTHHIIGEDGKLIGR